MLATDTRSRPDTIVTGSDFRARIAGGWKLAPRPSTEVWLTRHMRFPQGWESTSFDLDRAPHVRGVIERFWRDPRRRKANLIWSVRTQKTSTAIACMLDAAANDPAPMAILFPDEATRDSALDEHVYPICEATLGIRDQIPSPHKRNRIAIRFRNCRVRLAVGGSKASVSGYPAKFVFKFEHDKTTQRKSSEADASWRIESRTTGFESGVKILEEGSPGDMDTSRAYALLQSPHVMRLTWHVPCPFCEQYQPLVFAQVKWERDERGQSSPAIARRTAWYECAHCQSRILNHHRTEIMRAGRWVAEGETVDTRGGIHGTPEIDSDTMVFGPLPKLASLMISGWGDVAAEFVDAMASLERGDREPLRKFTTETLAEPWDSSPPTVNVDELTTHLAGLHVRGECPVGTAFLTMGVDVGSVGDQMFLYWLVTAWRAGCFGAVVDWGVASGVDEFRRVVAQTWPCGSQQIPLTPFPIGIDTGDLTTEVYQLCDTIPNAIPVKGDSSSSKTPKVDLFWWGHRSANVPDKILRARKRAGIGDLMFLNTHMSQQWRRALTERRLRPEHPGFVALPADVVDDASSVPFVQQLANDVLHEGRWEKVGPNEYGDCLRMCRVLAQWYTRNGRLWNSITLPANLVGVRPPSVMQTTGQTPAALPQQAIQRPVAGGGFLLSQR